MDSSSSDSETKLEDENSPEGVPYGKRHASLARLALHKWNPFIKPAEVEMSPGPTSILRALSADGDLSWLSNVGNVNEMFKRLSQSIETLRAEAQDEVRKQMNKNLTEIKKALNETVEVSSQRNSQLEVAVQTAEQAFHERDEARNLLRDANERLTEYANKVERLELSVGEAISSTDGFADMAEQLQETRQTAERYKQALAEAEQNLQTLKKMNSIKDVRISELESSKVSGNDVHYQLQYLREQLSTQKALHQESVQQHRIELEQLRSHKEEAEQEIEELRKQLDIPQSLAADSSWQRELQKDREALQGMISHQKDLMEQSREMRLAGTNERHQGALGGGSFKPPLQALADAEAASLGLFHVSQLRRTIELLVEEPESLGSTCTEAIQTLNQIEECIVSDTHRLVQYEGQIERLSADLWEEQQRALQLQDSRGGEAELERLHRQVAMHRSKEAKLEERAADLEARLERRAEQMSTAERENSDLRQKVSLLEDDVARLRSAPQWQKDVPTPKDVWHSQSDEVSHLKKQLQESANELNSLKSRSEQELRHLSSKLQEEARRRRSLEDKHSVQESAQGDAGAWQASSSRFGTDYSALASDVQDMKAFRCSTEGVLSELREQLHRATDRNQKLEETTRQLAIDKDGLRSEIRRMGETLQRTRAWEDIDSARNSAVPLPKAAPSVAAITEQERETRDGVGESALGLREASSEPEAPPSVVLRAAEFAGVEGHGRPRSAVPSALSGAAEAPAPADVLQRAAMFTGDEGGARPATAAPSGRADRAIARLTADAFPVQGSSDEESGNLSDGEGSLAGDSSTSLEFAVPTTADGGAAPAAVARRQSIRSWRVSQRCSWRNSARAADGKRAAAAAAGGLSEEAAVRDPAEGGQKDGRARRQRGGAAAVGASIDEEVVLSALRRAGLIADPRGARPAPAAGRATASSGAPPTHPRRSSAKANSRAGARAAGQPRLGRRCSSPAKQRQAAAPGRSKSAGRSRSLSAGRMRQVPERELNNPAGILRAGKNSLLEDRWLWSRFNPSKPFHPEAFSSVMRSRLFDESMRKQMLGKKP